MSGSLQAYIGYGIDLGKDLPVDQDLVDLEESFQLGVWCENKIAENLEVKQDLELYDQFLETLHKEAPLDDREEGVKKYRERIQDWKENSEEGQSYRNALDQVQEWMDDRLKFFGYGDASKKWAVLWEDTHVSADLLAGGGTSFRLDELEVEEDRELIQRSYDRFWEALDWKPLNTKPTWLLIPDYG